MLSVPCWNIPCSTEAASISGRHIGSLASGPRPTEAERVSPVGHPASLAPLCLPLLTSACLHSPLPTPATSAHLCPPPLPARIQPKPLLFPWRETWVPKEAPEDAGGSFWLDTLGPAVKSGAVEGGGPEEEQGSVQSASGILW